MPGGILTCYRSFFLAQSHYTREFLLYHEYKKYRDKAKDYDRLKEALNAKKREAADYAKPRPDNWNDIVDRLLGQRETDSARSRCKRINAPRIICER